ncbi:putative drug antiporter protein precursor [Flexivirga endophytica]|uniref:Drug antiporter protein n=1 Tax=Flexivirga endophytica TaxID=1849103 RepID=A0A916SSD0_9MICO|nr:MFS transporter [Flexivirga endophytica]GGB14674.1 putative drug antiporter protein precursor [Flexivirga endophytica]GHB65573.1 putative drug antiporter protein precursor [Flexivirga endophytica]
MSSRRPFAALAVAEAFSISGTRLSQIAVPWLVLTTTGSAVWTGVVGFAELLPYVVAKALGGPIVDRIGSKAVAVTADSCSVLIVGLIPLLHWLGMLQLGWLIPIAALMGVVRGPSDGAKSALVPTVAEQGAIPLERITGVMGAIERLGGTVGAAAAGAVVAVIGAPQALLVNAVTFAVAAMCISHGLPDTKSAQPQGDPVREEETGSSYRQQLVEGWRFLRGDSVLVGITVMVSLTNLLDQAWTAVLLPVWAHATGSGAGAVGLVLAAMAGPSILGALVAAAVGERLPRLPVYVLGFFVAGLPRFAVFALDVHLWTLVSVLAAAGFLSGFINPILGAVTFERIPPHLVGRVSALKTSLCWSLIPFGGLLGGVLSALIGWRAATVGVGIAYFLITLMPLVRKSFREFNKRPAGECVANRAGDDPVTQADAPARDVAPA